MTGALQRAPRMTVVAAVQPLTAGAAHFNTAMVASLKKRAAVDVISWRRMYPPLLYRGPQRDGSEPPPADEAAFILDWHDPRTWRRALRRVFRNDSDALVIPWLHPVMAAQSRWLLRHAPRRTCRVVVCHNVTPHESLRGAAFLTRAALRHADLLVTHAGQQARELAALGLGGIPLVEAFHPRFVATDLAAPPTEAVISAERRRLGDDRTLVLLCFGAIRPYKGLDIALEAVARVDPSLPVKLVVAGRFWTGEAAYWRQVERLGIRDRVEFRNRYVSNEEAARLFSVADAALLPYRSASQSGVVQLAYSHGCPLIATAVGGLPDAVADGEDAILCDRDDVDAIARAIERMWRDREQFSAAVERRKDSHSFERYAELLTDAIGMQQ
jgi:glycosyltransferase involved in cell wall biosynthesis